MIPSEEPCSTRIPRISEDNDCRTYFSQCCVEYPIITINYVKGLGSSDEHRDCATRAQALVEEGFNETDPAVESFIDACECCEEGRAFIGTHSAYVAHMDAMTDSWCRRAFEICASPGSDSTQDGDPHFVTFDGARITYNGPCRYTLTQTDPRYAGYLTPFTVTAMNAIHKADLASYLDDVEMTIGQRRVRMNVRGELFVDGQPQTAPISDGMFKVKRDVLANVLPFGPKRALGEPVLRLETGILVNLTVTVQRPDGKGRYYLNIEVPKMYRGKLTGLGGNFNGDPMDDYRLSDGRDVRNIWPEIFRSQMIADSWLVKDDPVNLKTGYPC
ncbi:IgGFc-binding protein-like [Lingula anatina]|uniref:IgGFc-binding protein-like n=1 Tax=Lingula anatina TaxID=7574 RepID=A0A1S3J5W0_LINAN|nr:IgGFc-binding protein-like [Lingula anatina]|eukprot:XP_013405636.1 IgGFc-binding protein-like [Lingula anatina]